LQYSSHFAVLTIPLKKGIQKYHENMIIFPFPWKREPRNKESQYLLDPHENWDGYNNLYSVYILASKRNATLYIGAASDLIKRVYEHKNDFVDGFTKKYSVHSLVYYEQSESLESVVLRERQMKKWNRKWKLEIIEKNNPDWKDLSDEIV
jgi:putative endonuclease